MESPSANGACTDFRLTASHVAAEPELLLDAFDSNWIAPMGPHVDAFEREFAEKIGVEHAVGALQRHGRPAPGDAAAGRRGRATRWPRRRSPSRPRPTPSAMSGARPVFIDSEREQLESRSRPAGRGVGRAARRGRPPRP